MPNEIKDYLISLKKDYTEEEKSNIESFNKYADYFLNKCDIRDFNEIAKVGLTELFKTFLVFNNPFKTNEIIYTFDKYFEEDTNSYLVITAIILYCNEETFKDLFELYEESNIFNRFKVMELINDFCEKTDVNKAFFIALNDFFKKNPETKELLISYIQSLDINETLLLLNLNTNYELYEASKDIPKKKKKMIDEFFYGKKSISHNELFELKSTSGVFYSRYTSALKQIKNLTQKNNRYNKRIDELINLLDKPNEITNIDNILRYINDDEELSNVVLDYINLHNEKIYKELLSKYELLRNNSEESFSLLFSKYTLDFYSINELERNNILKCNYDDIEKILIILSKLGYLNYEISFSNISLYKLEKIIELIDKNILNKEFFINHIDIIYDNNLFELLLNNIDYLSKYNINMINYPNSNEILLSNIFKYNLELLSNYGLSITKKITDINFLNDINLSTKLDILLISDLLENDNLDYLNLDIPSLLKIRLSNIINIEYQSITSINITDFTLGNIMVSKIDDSIQNDNIALPEQLKKYQINNITLDINGVLVSIPNLLKNLSSFSEINTNNIFNSIIYNSFYTFEEIDIILTTFINELGMNDKQLYLKLK